MNTKFFLLALALAAAGSSALATPVSPEEALARLGNSSRKAAALKPGSTPKLVHTAPMKNGSPAVYIFNKGNNAGYIVLPADDAAYPLLGYSEQGAFDSADIPPQMAWWLEQYASQIEYSAAHPANPLAASLQEGTRASREAIAPLIRTKWDQGAPYNNSCPLYGANRTYTGCVATSMAQVMNYFKYPEVGKGNISYESQSLQKRLTLNFALRKIDWDNMADTYLPGMYTQAEADAVSYLMKAAGYSVKMDYAADSSGALAMNISNGLVKYFGYDPNIDYQIRARFSASEWEKMVYENLRDVGPVLYGGGSLIGGGHSFICDGYDGAGFFHFNWGWSGMSDGYFSLDALAPSSLGAGGGGGGGYNFTQDAVFGVQPPTGKPAIERPKTLIQMGSLGGEIEADSLKFFLFAEESAMWVNYNPTTLKIKFGAIIEPQDGSGRKIYSDISKARYSIDPGYGTGPSMFNPKLVLPDLNLPDGTYKITIATSPLDLPEDQWTPVLYCHSYFNYLVLKKSGNQYTVENEGVWVLDLLEGECTDEKYYYGTIGNFHVKIENDSDLELTKGFAPAFLYGGAIYFIGESIYVTVPPHTIVDKEWSTPLYLLQNIAGISQEVTFDLAFFDEATYNFYFSADGNPVVMYPNPGAPRATQVTAPQLTNCKMALEELPNGAKVMVYLVDDPAEIQVKSRIRLNSGYYAYNTYACILKPDFTEGGEYAEILAYSGSPLFMSVPGLTATLNTTVSYPLAEPDTYYAVTMAFQYGSSLGGISGGSSFFRLATSGVDDIAAEPTEEEIGDGTIYNLQGMPIGKDMESLPKGLYIRNGKKILK